MREELFKIEKTPNLAGGGKLEKKPGARKGTWILERDQVIWKEAEETPPER